MPLPFWRTTAEDVLLATEAVAVRGSACNAQFVAAFADMRLSAAEAALNMAEALGFVANDPSGYRPAGPIAHVTRTANVAHKAAALRLLLDSYAPFVFFRDRLVATEQATQAAEQTRIGLDVAADRDDIRETLVSLASYAQAFQSLGGGRYAPAEQPVGIHLPVIAQALADEAAALLRIRERLGPDLAALVSHDDVLVPLAKGLLKALQGDPRGAIVEGGNAVESYLSEWATREHVSVANDHGINAKVSTLSAAHKIPGKLASASKYLGHLRNAADHGIDPDINAAWTFQASTGIEYVLVACSFVVACRSCESGGGPIL